MTPADLKEARKALGLSAEGFARLVGVQSGRTVRRWERGDRDIPGTVERLLEALAEMGLISREAFVRRLTDSARAP
jgi:DNA-binding transcriptional regulator YiaG